MEVDPNYLSKQLHTFEYIEPFVANQLILTCCTKKNKGCQSK